MPLAVVTHAHADHATWGCEHYVCSESSVPLMRGRIGKESRIDGIPFGERRTFGSVTLSLHPSGHLLGAAQIRIASKDGEVWVVSGDYKRDKDPSCEAFEPVACDTFISECTFGLPIYRWRPPHEVFADINQWWRRNAEDGRTSVIFAYALGKAQRILANVDGTIGPIRVHGAVAKFNPIYEAAGRQLAPSEYAKSGNIAEAKGCGLVVAPGSAQGTPWLRKFGKMAVGSASGWMQVRGSRRRQALDRGFVLSDHCDWPGLITSIRETGANRIGLTHGDTNVLARWLRERDWDVFELPSR